MDHFGLSKLGASYIEREWGDFATIATFHLNSQVRKFGGFTPGPIVFGRTPKLPIGAVGAPHFSGATNPADSKVTTTHGWGDVYRLLGNLPY